MINCLIHGLERSVWQQSGKSKAGGLQSTSEAASNERVHLDQWQWDREEDLCGALRTYNQTWSQLGCGMNERRGLEGLRVSVLISWLNDGMIDE